MGWYVTCEDCGQQEKYSHPHCGCRQKRWLALQKKIVESHSRLINMERLNEDCGTAILMHLRNDEGKELYIEHFIVLMQDCDREVFGHEITAEHYHSRLAEAAKAATRSDNAPEVDREPKESQESKDSEESAKPKEIEESKRDKRPFVEI